jgi:hypothetical protein
MIANNSYLATATTPLLYIRGRPPAIKRVLIGEGKERRRVLFQGVSGTGRGK